MATIKLLSSKDDKATDNHLKTTSGIDLKNLATAKPVSEVGFLTKQHLYDEIQKGNLIGNLKEPDGEMYDHLVVELGSNSDYAESAAPIILARFQKPNLSFVKNQGNGRIQEKKVTGEKEVLFDLHKENNGDYHLHILVSRYSIDGKTVNPQDSQKDKYVRATYLNKINEDLDMAGLAQLRDFSTSITSSNTALPKPSITTQNEVKELLQGNKTIDEIVLENASITDTVLDDSANKLEKELSQILEQAKKKQEELNQVRNARSVLDENLMLKRATTELKAQVEVLKVVEEEKAQLEIDLEAKNNEVAEANNARITLEETLAEKEKSLQEWEEIDAQSKEDLEQKELVISSLNEEIGSIRVQVDKLAENNDKLIHNLNHEKEKVGSLNTALMSKDEQLNLEKSFRESLTKQHEEMEKRFNEQLSKANTLEEQNKAIMQQMERNQALAQEVANNTRMEFEARFNEQQKQIEQLQVTNAKVVKENSVLKDFVQVIEEKLEQATTIISSLATRLKNASQKRFINTFVEHNKLVNEQVKQLDKDIETKATKIDELRALFQSNKAGVNKFAEQEKLEQDKPAKKTTSDPKNK